MINRIVYFFDAYSSLFMYNCVFVLGFFIYLKIKGFYKSIKYKNKDERYTYDNFVNWDFAKFANKTVCCILIVCIVVSIILTLLFSPVIQETLDIHNLYLESGGYHCYNISVFDYDTQNETVVPAKIKVETDDGFRRHWYIVEFYMPNGDWYFYDGMLELVEIEPNGMCYAFDENCIEWGEITLLNESATSDKLRVTNRITVYNIIGLFISLFSQLFVIVTLYLIPGTDD